MLFINLQSRLPRDDPHRPISVWADWFYVLEMVWGYYVNGVTMLMVLFHASLG